MAEFIMKEKLKKIDLSETFIIESRGTSSEEEGHDIYPLAKKKLEEENISYTPHQAKQLEPDDYDKFDYFICMEKANIKGISYIFDDPLNKVSMLRENDIKDPWYTRNFDETFEELNTGIDDLIKKIRK